MLARICALMALAAALFAVFAQTGNAAPLTAAFCRSQPAAISHRDGAFRSLSSAQTKQVHLKCVLLHTSLSKLSFIQHHQWMIAPRYDKWWQVPGQKYRLLVRKIRKKKRNNEAAAAWLKDVIERQTQPQVDPALVKAFLCIHRFEGAWNSNTGNGYYGGLQMDQRFMQLYGAEFVARWGTADNWPVWAQLEAAVKAHHSGRGFTPWPNTARACGLL